MSFVHYTSISARLTTSFFYNSNSQPQSRMVSMAGIYAASKVAF